MKEYIVWRTKVASFSLPEVAACLARCPCDNWLSGASSGARWNNVIVGIALILLSVPRGRVHEQYGAWNKYVV